MAAIVTDMLMPVGARAFVGTAASTFSTYIFKLRAKLITVGLILPGMHFGESTLPLQEPSTAFLIGGGSAMSCWSKVSQWFDISGLSKNAQRKCVVRSRMSYRIEQANDEELVSFDGAVAVPASKKNGW
jgi:hypothetical protein